MAKKAIVFLAEGFEEVEALTPVDYLRRAGIEVMTLRLGSGGDESSGGAFLDGEEGLLVKGSHGIVAAADAGLYDVRGGFKAADWDAVICPGGMPGAAIIAASKEAGAFIKAMFAAGKLAAAICAAPAVVLAPLGLLAGKRYTCFPNMEKEVSAALNPAAVWCADRVVADGNLITSRGAGTAGEFAVAIISYLLSEKEGKAIAEKVLMR